MRIKGAEKQANFSGQSLARLLGEISPKIRMVRVNTTVETVAPRLGSFNRSTKIRVAMVDAAMLTTLFPIKMVEISLS